MRAKIALLLAIAALLADGYCQGRQSENFEIPADVVDCSGGSIASGSHAVFFTCSEPVTVGYSASDPFQLYAGFIPRHFQVMCGASHADSGDLRDRLSLKAWGPNPFSRTTQVRFTLPVQAHAVISIYDACGKKIGVICEGLYEAGSHTASWDGRDNRGIGMSAGMYFLVIESAGERRVQKLVLVK